MSKPQKIIRYDSIYAPKKRTFLKILGVILLIAILGFVGWSVYTPLYDFIMAIGEKPPAVTESSQPSTPTNATSSDVTSDGSAITPGQPTESKTNTRGVYAPFEIVSQPEKLDQFLKDLRGTNINAVMVDAKNSNGEVLYRSQVSMAIENLAVLPNAFDAKTVANKISAEGFTPIARINAFKDPLAARANRQAAVSFLDSDFTWLDNSPNLGGRPWLNPYAKISRDYIISIASELTQCGFKQLIVESVQFPSGVGLEKAGFGTTAAGITRLEALSSFAKELETAVLAAGGKSSVYLSGTSILAENQQMYGGNPLKIPYKSSVVEIISPNFASNTAVGDIIIESPQAEFAKTVAVISGYARKNLGEDFDMTAIISAITKDGTVLSLAAIDEQVKALEAESRAGYILYNPNGKYGLK